MSIVSMAALRLAMPPDKSVAFIQTPLGIVSMAALRLAMPPVV